MILLSSAASIASTPVSALASTVDLRWSAPTDCPTGASLREGLSKRLGREVTFSADAPVRVEAEVVARGAGYELDLRTRSASHSDQRRLQASSCNELARATLLIASVLLLAEPAGEAPSAAHSPDMLPEPARPRSWFVSASVRAVGDVGSLAAASLGPAFGIGLGLSALRFELAAIILPSQRLDAPEPESGSATLQLTAASAGACWEFFDGPLLSPCLRVELGRLRGRGLELQSTQTADGLWLVTWIGARGGLPLLEWLLLRAELSLGLPLSRPAFAVEGLGTLHKVPAAVGRLELGVEVRL